MMITVGSTMFEIIVVEISGSLGEFQLYESSECPVHSNISGAVRSINRFVEPGRFDTGIDKRRYIRVL